MIVNADAKSLEWITYLHISQDKNGIEEWLSFVEDPKLNDIHTKNQNDFHLPNRGVSKAFLFRCIYRGPAFAYARDPDFTHVSTSVKYWQEVIDNFFDKYWGLNQKHLELIREATTTGKTISPFGRVHEHQRNRKGEWNIPDIANHINQGVGADVMAVARVSFANRWMNGGFEGKLISTVHDSIVLDVPDREVQSAAEIMFDVFRDLPKNISRAFNVKWELPMLVEVGHGSNMKDLTEIKLC